MFNRKLMGALAALLLSLTTQKAWAKTYFLPLYELSVTIPDSHRACWTPGMKDVFSVDALVDPRDKTNPCYQDAHVVRFFADSISDDSDTLRTVRFKICRDVPGPCSPAPAHLIVPGHKTLAFKQSYADGTVEVYVTLTHDVARVGGHQRIFYIFSVLTTPRHFERDVAFFRKLLKDVRFGPAAPER